MSCKRAFPKWRRISKQACRDSPTILTSDWQRFRLSCAKNNASASNNFRWRLVRLRFLKTAGAARWNHELKSLKIKPDINVVETRKHCKLKLAKCKWKIYSRESTILPI